MPQHLYKYTTKWFPRDEFWQSCISRFTYITTHSNWNHTYKHKTHAMVFLTKLGHILHAYHAVLLWTQNLCYNNTVALILKALVLTYEWTGGVLSDTEIHNTAQSCLSSGACSQQKPIYWWDNLQLSHIRWILKQIVT